jgi:hypothetical protein
LHTIEWYFYDPFDRTLDATDDQNPLAVV